MYIYVSKYLIKTLQPEIGHRLDTSGQRTANGPANRCRCLFASMHERGAGRRCCRTRSGGPRSSASLLETLHRSYGAGNRKQREKRPEAARQHFVLSTRDPLSSSSSSSFYSSRTSRSALNAYLPYLTLFDPPRYLTRP